jgi:adenine-specific DNA methylase
VGDLGVQQLSKNSTSDSNVLRTLPPSTRYQGSKRRILAWLFSAFEKLKFETVLDGFGGTASVSYLLKSMKKQVCYNDFLLSNYYIGLALVENNQVKLDRDDLKFILRRNGFHYPSFIENSFGGVYYLDHENRWLDTVVYNIKMLSEKYDGEILKIKRAIAFFALFQACLCKRPFNLFHRKNLNLRLANVTRSFGNKTTWDTDFEKLFLRFNNELSNKIFSNGYANKAECSDILKFKERDFDLVYFDPPYVRPEEKSPQDYFSLYHFLEGLVDYENWGSKIDWTRKNKCLIRTINTWETNNVEENFEHLFSKFRDSIIVVSYSEPGYPAINKIKDLLLQYKSKVEVIRTDYRYKLNRKNGQEMHEVLITGN